MADTRVMNSFFFDWIKCSTDQRIFYPVFHEKMLPENLIILGLREILAYMSVIDIYANLPESHLYCTALGRECGGEKLPQANHVNTVLRRTTYSLAVCSVF